VLYSSRVLDPATEPLSFPPVEPARRVRPAQRLGAALEILLCSGFPTQLLLLGALNGLGLRMQTADGHLSPTFVFTLSLADTAVVVALVFFLLNVHRESPRHALLGERPVLREVFVGIALIPVMLTVVVVVLALIFMFARQLHNVDRNPFEDMLQTRRDILVFGIVAMVAGGVREELQRGFILHRFEQYLGGGVVGVFLYSALFGLGHWDQGYDAAIATALLGAVWGIVYLIRRSIIAPMVSHAGFNLAQVLKYVTLS
jgi:membrane protease YdiL (CAAX protease family)